MLCLPETFLLVRRAFRENVSGANCRFWPLCPVGVFYFAYGFALSCWILGGRSGYFYFFARGRGRRSPSRWEGGGFLLKIPGRGGSPGRGAEGPGGSFRQIFWGGAKYFFSGPKCPPRIFSRQLPENCLLLRGVLKNNFRERTSF